MEADRYSKPTTHNHIGIYKTPAICDDVLLKLQAIAD
jgi:hypothetical protein